MSSTQFLVQINKFAAKHELNHAQLPVAIILNLMARDGYGLAVNWGLCGKDKSHYDSGQVEAVRAFNNRRRYSMFKFEELMSIVFGPTWSCEDMYQSRAGPRTDPKGGDRGRTASYFLPPGELNGYMPNASNDYSRKYILMSLDEMKGK